MSGTSWRQARPPARERRVAAPGSLARGAAVLLALTLLAGCALTARRTRSSIDETRSERARELAAERRAPLAFSRFRAAQRAAAASRDESAERGDLASEARLWLELAIAESERQLSSERRLEEERALVELDAKIVRLERERSALAGDNELRAARAIARKEAERALARAAQRPQLRVKLPREEVKRAAEALVARAELVGLTLASLGKESPALARLREKVVETRALLAKEPEASLARADQTLFFALSLLSSIRDGESAPTAEEKAALAEELALAGLHVGRGDGGLTGVLEQPFTSGQLTPEASRMLERLCALAKAHPSGPIQLSVQASTRAQADALARLVAERFRALDCSGGRFVFRGAARGGELLEASFVAY